MKTSASLFGVGAITLSLLVGNSRAGEPGSAAENVPTVKAESNQSAATLIGSNQDKGNHLGAPRLSSEIKEILKMQESGIDKNVIRSYIETSSASSQPTSEEIIYLHQRGIPDDLTAALIQHNAQVRAQTPISAVNHGMTENHSMPVAQNSTPVAQAPLVVQAEPSPSVQSPVYVYPQYSGSYSYPVYYPSVSFGYYGGYWPYYGYGYYPYCGSYYHGGYHYYGNHGYANHGWAGNHGGGYSVSGGHSGGGGYSMVGGHSGGGGYSMAGGHSGGGRSMGGGGGGHR